MKTQKQIAVLRTQNIAQEIARLIKFTVTGHTLHSSYVPANPGDITYSNCRCNGYESPESFVKPYHWWADAKDVTRTHYGKYVIPSEGVPVVDIRQAIETKDGYSWVFQGPLLDCDLPDGEVDSLCEPSEPFGSIVDANFGGLLTLQRVTRITQKRGALDSVSVSEYVQGWKEHGARIGSFTLVDGIASIAWLNP